MEWINRFLCWFTGNHIYDFSQLFILFPRCRYCNRSLEERCTGWPEK